MSFGVHPAVPDWPSLVNGFVTTDVSYTSAQRSAMLNGRARRSEVAPVTCADAVARRRWAVLLTRVPENIGSWVLLLVPSRCTATRTHVTPSTSHVGHGSSALSSASPTSTR